MIDNIDLKKAIAPYKIVSQGDSYLRLHRRYDIKAMFVLLIITFIVFRQLVAAPKIVYLYLILLFLIIFLLYRWTVTKHPMNINVEHDFLTLGYKKYFGGINQVIINSTNIKGIRADVISSGHSGIFAVIQIILSNNIGETLYFARRQYNKKLVIEFSKLIAKTFASILVVPLLEENGSSKK